MVVEVVGIMLIVQASGMRSCSKKMLVISISSGLFHAVDYRIFFLWA